MAQGNPKAFNESASFSRRGTPGPEINLNLPLTHTVSDSVSGQATNFTGADLESRHYKQRTAEMGERRKGWEQQQQGDRMWSPIASGTNKSRSYASRGWKGVEEEHAGAASSMHDYDTLAQSGNNVFPQPKRWEALSSEEQGRTHAALKYFGTDVSRMSQDFGSQLDQAHYRSQQMGSTHPFGSDFYEPHGAPRQVMASLSEQFGHPSPHVAAAIASTSPRTKFTEFPAEGQPQFTNAVAAGVAMKIEANYEDLTSRAPSSTGKGKTVVVGEVPTEAFGQMARELGGTGGVGMHENVMKAAYGFRQARQGVPVQEWRNAPSKTNPEGSHQFATSAKTSPFASQLMEGSTPFLVSDIHTGGGGALPHLSPEKGSGYNLVKNKANVNPEGFKKSEREYAIEQTPNFHAVADYAMRQAMGERGLEKTRFAQATQWGEEQIRRSQTGTGSRALSYDADKVYQWHKSRQDQAGFKRYRHSESGRDLLLPTR